MPNGATSVTIGSDGPPTPTDGPGERRGLYIFTPLEWVSFQGGSAKTHTVIKVITNSAWNMDIFEHNQNKKWEKCTSTGGFFNFQLYPYCEKKEKGLKSEIKELWWSSG